MRIVLSYVTSVDGFLSDNEGKEPTTWASKEDQQYFKLLREELGVVLMGSNTYEAHKDIFTKEDGVLRIVMTKDAAKYESTVSAGTLEFSPLAPKEVIAVLERRGYTQALMAGGPTLYRAFFELKLIQEIYVTVEPVLFGGGLTAATGIPEHVRLTLTSHTKMNDSGTLLLKYKVLY